MSNRYINPVVLAEDMPEPTKTREVVIHKSEIFKDIDLFTHKHVDAREDLGNRPANAVSSDTAEKVDGAVIARYVEFRDAQLRNRCQRILADKQDDSANSDLSLAEDSYRYVFNVPESFNDNALRPLAEYIHRFLVFGALYDWYSQFGMPQAGVYGSQLDEIEEYINSITRGPSIVKRPLQPFGPAKPM